MATNATERAWQVDAIYVQMLKKEGRCGPNHCSEPNKLSLRAHVYAVTLDACAHMIIFKSTRLYSWAESPGA